MHLHAEVAHGVTLRVEGRKITQVLRRHRVDIWLLIQYLTAMHLLAALQLSHIVVLNSLTRGLLWTRRHLLLDEPLTWLALMAMQLR